MILCLMQQILLQHSRNVRDCTFPASKRLHYKRGFITKEQLVELAQPLLKTAYGKYLIEIAEGCNETVGEQI